MDRLFINALVRLQILKNRFFEEERGAEAIVTIVVLIGVAVLLAIVFKGAIKDLLTNLFNTIQNTSTDAINNSPT